MALKFEVSTDGIERFADCHPSIVSGCFTAVNDNHDVAVDVAREMISTFSELHKATLLLEDKAQDLSDFHPSKFGDTRGAQQLYSERQTKFQNDVKPVETTQNKIEALSAKLSQAESTLRFAVESKFAQPTSPGLAQEIRNYFRGLTSTKQTGFVSTAAAAGDTSTLGAIMNKQVPFYLVVDDAQTHATLRDIAERKACPNEVVQLDAIAKAKALLERQSNAFAQRWGQTLIKAMAKPIYGPKPVRR